MDYIEGQSIDAYCDRNSLTIRDRLLLFRSVCAAVQFMHGNSIVHRDLKCSNILVTADGTAKLTDFGVAMLLDRAATLQESRCPDTGAPFVTPAYASPEQVRGERVTAASDVYSLGVILYELLTGHRPYDILDRTQQEIEKAVCEHEPEKPSVVVNHPVVDRLPDGSVRTSSPESVSRVREASMNKLRRVLKGDVDAIVLKTLSKAPHRRYGSVDKLVGDLDAFLENRPVQALPPRALDVLAKFCRRHRWGVLGVAGMVLGLLVALIAEQRQRRLAEKQRVLATREATTIKTINEFLVNDLLGAVVPQGNVDQPTLRTILDAAAQKLDGKFPDAPEVEASIHSTIGDTYRRLGQYERAEEHFEQALKLRRDALGEEHADTLEAMNNLASLYENQGRYSAAEPLATETLGRCRRTLGEEHRITLAAMTNLAVLYNRLGRYDEAHALFERLPELCRRVLGEFDRETLVSINNLAFSYQSRSEYAKAETYFLQALKASVRVFGEDHADTLAVVQNLAALYGQQGRYEEAEHLTAGGLDRVRHAYGNEHPTVLVWMQNLATLYDRLGRYDEAERLATATLDLKRRVLGEEHQETLIAMNNLALLYIHQRRYDAAEQLYVRALPIARRVLGTNHPTVQSVSPRA